MIVKEYNIFEKGINAIVVTVGLLLCIWTATTMKATVATAIGLIPFLLTFIFICIKRPTILLCITFIINYIIMGINRYYPIPIPITNIFDLLFGIMLTLIILKQVYTDDDNRKNAMNAYTFVLLGWLLYCIINAGNGITGELYPEAWLRILRPWAIYPLLTCFILSIHCNRYSFLHYFLILWGIFTLLAAAKGYWQKNKGFDSTELAWLWAYGARTHFIHSGIRYFSFFTDAAIFGSTMGLSCTTFFLSALYSKNRYLKLFYFVVSMAGFYGLLIAGTRAAIAIPIAGLGVFLFLSKNWKIGMLSFLLLVGGVGMLKYTKIGEDNRLIRRMRTVFDSNDQSLLVRKSESTQSLYVGDALRNRNGRTKRSHFPSKQILFCLHLSCRLKPCRRMDTDGRSGFECFSGHARRIIHIGCVYHTVSNQQPRNKRTADRYVMRMCRHACRLVCQHGLFSVS